MEECLGEVDAIFRRTHSGVPKDELRDEIAFQLRRFHRRGQRSIYEPIDRLLKKLKGY
jgi:hypothetical protein